MTVNSISNCLTYAALYENLKSTEATVSFWGTKQVILKDGTRVAISSLHERMQKIYESNPHFNSDERGDGLKVVIHITNLDFSCDVKLMGANCLTRICAKIQELFFPSYVDWTKEKYRTWFPIFENITIQQVDNEIRRISSGDLNLGLSIEVKEMLIQQNKGFDANDRLGCKHLTTDLNALLNLKPAERTPENFRYLSAYRYRFVSTPLEHQVDVPVDFFQGLDKPVPNHVLKLGKFFLEYNSNEAFPMSAIHKIALSFEECPLASPEKEGELMLSILRLQQKAGFEDSLAILEMLEELPISKRTCQTIDEITTLFKDVLPDLDPYEYLGMDPYDYVGLTGRPDDKPYRAKAAMKHKIAMHILFALPSAERTSQNATYIRKILHIEGRGDDENFKFDDNFENDIVDFVEEEDPAKIGKLLQVASFLRENFHISIIQTLETLSIFSLDELNSFKEVEIFFKLMLPFIKQLEYQPLVEFCEIAHSLSKSETRTFIAQAKRILALRNKDDISDCSIELSIFALLPKEVRKSKVGRDAIDRLRENSGKFSEDEIDSLYAYLREIPPDIRLEVLNKAIIQIENDSESFDLDIVIFEYHDASKAYLNVEFDKVLQGTGQPGEWARLHRLAVQISIGYEELGIDDPLWDKAMQVYALTSKNKQDSRKNPCLIFRKLQQIARSETLIDLQSPQKHIWVVGAPESYEEYDVNFTLAQFRELIKTGKYQLKDLPQGIKPDSFRRLFTDLNASLAIGDRDKAQAEVMALTEGQPLNELEEEVLGVLNHPSEVEKYLKVQYSDSNVSVSSFAYNLHTIMRYIYDLKKEVLLPHEGN